MSVVGLNSNAAADRCTTLLLRGECTRMDEVGDGGKAWFNCCCCCCCEWWPICAAGGLMCDRLPPPPPYAVMSAL